MPLVYKRRFCLQSRRVLTLAEEEALNLLAVAPSFLCYLFPPKPPSRHLWLIPPVYTPPSPRGVACGEGRQPLLPNNSPSPNKISKAFSNAPFGEGDKGGEVNEKYRYFLILAGEEALNLGEAEHRPVTAHVDITDIAPALPPLCFTWPGQRKTRFTPGISIRTTTFNPFAKGE